MRKRTKLVVVRAVDAYRGLFRRWIDDRFPGNTRCAGAEGEDVKDDPVAVSASVRSGADVAD